MLGFMDYVQNAYYEASHWNRDNSYGTLLATAQALLDFETPRGLRFHASSLASPNFASSYTIGSVGLVDGSISYLYSSLPLRTPSASSEIDLHDVVTGYRHLPDLRRPDEDWWWEVWHAGRRVDRRDTLLYGRLYLPRSALEALYMRRLSPTRLLRLSCVSDTSLPNAGTILAHLTTDTGKYSTEYLYSTDSGLIGLRGLYNFGPDPRRQPHIYLPSTPTRVAAATAAHTLPSPLPPPAERPEARISWGGEVYYGALNRTFGLSTGLRFSTLAPAAAAAAGGGGGFPYTMTLTLNPLMGNLSATYAVKAGARLALASRFDFNFYSYESGVQVGLELWKRSRRRRLQQQQQQQQQLLLQEGQDEGGTEWVRRLMRPGWEGYEAGDAVGKDAQVQRRDGAAAEMAKPQEEEEEDTAGVLKARVDERMRIGVLWEGRIKELLFTLGASFDFRRREHVFRAVGVEVQFSS